MSLLVFASGPAELIFLTATADPLLLELSIRDNLDLEGTCSDQELWAALEQTQCKALVEALPDKLETLVSGDGGDFSRGERQLLALARALLRKRKILVLDEASSSLDIASDARMQEVLRRAFDRCSACALLILCFPPIVGSALC